MELDKWAGADEGGGWATRSLVEEELVVGLTRGCREYLVFIYATFLSIKSNVSVFYWQS